MMATQKDETNTRARYRSTRDRLISETDDKRVGKLIVELRARHRMTQEELGAEMGMNSRIAWGYYERGERKFTTDMLRKICRIFKVEMSYFYPDAGTRKDEIGQPVEWTILAGSDDVINLTPDEAAALKPILDLLLANRRKAD